MPDINHAILRERCKTHRDHLYAETALLACDALGGLSRWWLADWVFDAIRGTKKASEYPELSARERPGFPDKPGSCWVVFCNQKPDSFPMLGAGCVLPLCWKRGDHSASLPKDLVKVANEVVESLDGIPGFNGPWGLHLADLPRLDQVRLDNDLPLGYESGWAALAAGLITFVEDQKPKSDCWATGEWQPHHGLWSVDDDGLKLKLALAVEWKIRHFFVPEQNYEVAKQWVWEIAPDEIDIGLLRRTAEPSPMLTLNQYLAKATVPPEAPEEGHPEEEKQFQRCRNHYLIQDAKPARDYYRGRLLPAIIRHCQRRYDALPLSRRFSHFITIVSDHHELVLINPRVVRASNCLLLYHDAEGEDKFRKQADDCRRLLETKGVKCSVPRHFPMGTEMPHVLAAAVAEFQREVPSDQVALDLTPGTKLMSYALSQAAKPGNWLFCLEVSYPYDRCPDGRPDPGSERPALLPVRY